jgi:hypothetical protein
LRNYKEIAKVIIHGKKMDFKLHKSLKISNMNRKLRMGMVGGGKDAFIGAIHRLAANMDGLIEVSCGALSIRNDQERSKPSSK